MSKQESMLGMWSMTLVPVLTGLLMASHEMALAGEEEKIIEMLEKDMRDGMRGATSEQRHVLALILARLSEMVENVESPASD